ncbi:MAG TPA: sigma-70 family RNA polymerase sigma factor [Thermoanaerobaculia bacterium]
MATFHPPELPPEQLFLDNLKLIEQVAVHACKRAHFSPQETEEFVSTVKCKIIEDDYGIIRKFQGKSSFRTYLTIVVQHLFLDYQNHRWGKWRPSEEAKRLGPVAVQLERLLSRDGYSLGEASEILRTNHHVGMSPQELTDLATKLPPRNPHRRMEGEEVLQSQPSLEKTPAEVVMAREAMEKRGRIRGLLREALDSLVPEDRLIVKMLERFSVAEIARTLNLEQKPLYRRLKGIYATLRKYLESKGVRAEDIGDILGND